MQKPSEQTIINLVHEIDALDILEEGAFVTYRAVRKHSTAENGQNGLGVEGWLGLMVLLGLILGLIYACLTLP